MKITYSVSKLYARIIVFLFIILGCYFLQGTIYPSGSIISQVLIFAFLCISSYYFIKVLLRRNNIYPITIWTVFCLMQILTFIFSPKIVVGSKFEAIGPVQTFNQAKEVLTFGLSLFVGYYIGCKSAIQDSTLAKIGIALVLLSIIRFIGAESEFYTSKRGMVVSGFTNNVAYNFVSLVAFIPFIIKEYGRNIGLIVLGVIIIFTITGAKKGAILTLGVLMLVWLIYYCRYHRLSLDRLFYGIMLIIGLLLLVNYKYNNNKYLQGRVEQMETRGVGMREIGYKYMWNHWINEDIPEKIFGKGTAQTVEVWGNYAHNDWLELLIDNGLIGVCIYMIWMIGILKFLKKTELRYMDHLVAYLSIFFLLSKSMFSMGYSYAWGAFLMMTLGIILSRARLKNYK